LQATIDKRPEPFNEALRRPNAKLAMLRSRPRHQASRAQAGSAAAGWAGEQDGVQYRQGSLHSSIRPISSPQRSAKKR